MSTTGVKLDDRTQSRLKALGKARDRSPHWLMRKAIDEYLAKEEKYEREKAEDLAEYEDYLLTGDAIDNKEVVAWLDDMAGKGKYIPWPK